MGSKKETQNRDKCFECYGSHSGCCINTGNIFRDEECKYYVDFFVDRQYKRRSYRRWEDGDSIQ